MFIFLLPLTLACNYPIKPGSDCTGTDTRTVLGEFSMVWIWLSLSVTLVFGLMVSIIRDIMPRTPLTDTANRYHSGESRSICRFLVEEYLLTGWLVAKSQWRFTYTSRWCLIILIIYTDIFITGLLYQQDYENPNSFTSRDFIYGLVSTLVTFCVYLIAYFLLRIRAKDEDAFVRKMFGFVFISLMWIACTVFVFVFTYKVHDNTKDDYTNMVNHWMAAFGYSMFLEVMVSENIRIITRSLILWKMKFNPEEPMQTGIELSSIERNKYTYEDEF